MPRRIYIQRLVNLEQTDYWTVHRYADEKGWGGKGFSVALRESNSGYYLVDEQ